MDTLFTIKENTGFSASINNFISTADDYKYFENSSEKLSGLEIIKNEFFVIEEQPDPLEVSTESYFKHFA